MSVRGPADISGVTALGGRSLRKPAPGTGAGFLHDALQGHLGATLSLAFVSALQKSLDKIESLNPNRLGEHAGDRRRGGLNSTQITRFPVDWLYPEK